MLIVADIAGQLDAVERLVDRVDKSEGIVLLGDLVDRGPYSAEVVEWAMKNPRVIALMGNHEHMMLDYWLHWHIYQEGIWEMNGGVATLLSYDRKYGKKRPPSDHLEWLASLRKHYWVEDSKCLATHAPMANYMEFEDAMSMESSVLWNRSEPKRRDFFQVFGHNSHWGLRPFGDEDGTWALCIDQSQKEILTGFHWPSGEILEEPYLRTKKATI
jgi:hypothetical protein